jgi:hypothetical protein
MPTNLTKLTKTLGTTHQRHKNYVEQLAKYRSRFFDAATEEVSKQTLPRKIVKITLPISDERAREVVEAHHQGWKIIAQDGKRFQIEQLPEFISFVYINNEDGKRYRKRVDEGKITLDDELLREIDPKLWMSITEYEHINFLLDISYLTYQSVKELADKYGFKRVLKDPTTWTAEERKKVEPYWYIGPPRVVLEEPKLAKPEELSESET